jgi:alkyldihydroxyacetonephosphate synthase
MRRWNGWGKTTTYYALPQAAASYLESQVGQGCTAPDADQEEVLRSIPEVTLPYHPMIKTEAIERLMHARGQSLPDWVALRSGQIGSFPAGVAYPSCADDVRDLLTFAYAQGLRVIPYGGGTSVVGHINPAAGGPTTITLDLGRLGGVADLDETSHLARVGAGTAGPALEEQLNRRGYTLGHFPQSFELSTVGGWIATRSSGQQSYYYGRIEDLFAGGELVTPRGTLSLPVHPASAAGPDLRQLILGSEGRMGVITQAVLRVQRLPAAENFYGIFFPNWESGIEAVRAIAQSGTAVSMLRLSSSVETETTLQLSGKDRLVGAARRGLGVLGYGAERSLLILGITGGERAAREVLQQARQIYRQHGGLNTGTTIGKQWRKSRFHTPYLRNTLWEQGYALDTLETALPWSQVLPAAMDIQSALSTSLEQAGQRGLVFTHLSHVYSDGASIYTTYLFPRASDPEHTLEIWRSLKRAASLALQGRGGTISHQHGVGRDHAPYLAVEKGPLGIDLIRSAVETLDPKGLMNPGVLLGDQHSEK